MKEFKNLNEVPVSNLQPGQYVFFASPENLNKGIIAGGTFQQAKVNKEGSPILTISSRKKEITIEGEMKIFPENFS